MRRRGIPIGNLTSQIFANIYLNELDRFVVHTVKPLRYLRYGDDFIVFGPTRTLVEEWRKTIRIFLANQLGLVINRKNDIIVPAQAGLHFLGVQIFPTGRCLTARNRMRAQERLTPQNVSSYRGLVSQHENIKRQKFFDWFTLEKLL